MAHVFVSYKREDAGRVRKLVAALRAAGLETWWDDEIPPAAPWEETIEKALAEAQAVIVCWSPASVASENVRSEARVAREDGRLIQLFIKDCAPPLFFGERQGVDLTKWRGNPDDPRIARIVDAVGKVAAGGRIECSDKLHPRGRLERRGAIIIALLAILLLAGSFFIWRSAVAHPAPEVAVLPFEDLSPTHDKGYFAEGVSEEILSSLSTDKAVKVLGRTSAQQISHDADPGSLRRSLGITHLLEGSARTAGDALRVDVRLIDTSDGTTVWQDEYQGRLSDVFAVQDHIASAVVQHLRGVFAPAVPDRPVTKVNVYDTYLAARAIMRNRSEPSLKQALGLAQQVIATDPNYAPGQALYAEIVWLLSDDPDSYGAIPAATAARVGEEHARTAIRLAPAQADGYAALGLIQRVADGVAVPALKRAISLDPSRADVRIWLAIRLTKAAHYDEALQRSREASAIEPLWALPIADLVTRLAAEGSVSEARQVADQYRSRGGREAQYYRLLLLIASRGPDVSSAVAEGKKAYSLDPTLPDIRVNLMNLYYLIGLEDRARISIPAAFVRLSRPFYFGDTAGLEAEVRRSGQRLWELPDNGIGFFHLASVHDWTTLNRLYDAKPLSTDQLCFRFPEAVLAIVPALRAAGRQQDAESLIDCLRGRLTLEASQKARSPYEYSGDYEFGQATLAAFSGDKEAALRWLGQAVAQGWLGRPYSPAITDRPQFEVLRSDPRLAALQARIDRIIAEQRAKVLAAPR